MEKGSEVVWAYASRDSQYPSQNGWRVPYNGPLDDSITLSWISPTVPEKDDDEASYDAAHAPNGYWIHGNADAWVGTANKAAWGGNGGDYAVGEVTKSSDAVARDAGGYVEWRRMLPHDDLTDGLADHNTFLRLRGRLGLHSDVPTPSEINVFMSKISLP